MRAFEFLKERDERVSTMREEDDREVTIAVPQQDNVEIQNKTTIAAPATTEFPEDPVWIYPSQQMLELAKQAGGKQSPVINQIVKSDNGVDSDPSDGVFADLEDDDVATTDKRSIYYDCALKTNGQ